jgi:arsenate reductase
MTVIVYGINNCDTCRKARRWLDDAGADYRWHDIRKDGVTESMIGTWLNDVGTAKLINRRGRSWRELDNDEQSKLEAGKPGSFVEHPTVIKRPVLEHNGRVSVGFDPSGWQMRLPVNGK